MVEGLDKLDRRWGAVPEAVRAAAKEALEKNAQELVQAMRRFVPKDSMALANSIGWTWGEAPAGSMSVGSVGAREYGTMRITIYAGNEQSIVTNKRGIRFQNARIQEFGTKKMPANPFFYPAWRALRRRQRARLARAIRQAIKKAAST